MKNFTHITGNERRRIERALKQKESLRSIAKKLHRSVSSISDEIKLNTVKGEYIASKANHKARTRRKYSKVQVMKVVTNSDLREFVIKNILNDQSPESISGRIKHVEKNLEYVSTKAIYKFVYSVYGRQIENHLYSKSVKKKGGPKRNKLNVIDNKRTIDERPESVQNRKEFGHFEGDFIESGKDGKGSLLVLVERKTRYPFLVYTKKKDTTHINNLISKTLKDIPLKSLTLDRDLAFQKHENMSELLEATIFFCHAYCSQEKGTVENRNKAIRRYIPKRSDLSSYPLDCFKKIEMKLRNKFMKCLNYKTPQEAWDEEMSKIGNKKTPVFGALNQRLKTKIKCSD